ncbi:unnamed protein product [Ectocarpus sp. 8 AP-2014]
MLVSRSLLHRRSPVVDSGDGGNIPADATAAAAAAGPETLEPDRYAMHALQAAYVRSVARGRLDLMKTLDARREAALLVPGPDRAPALETAAAVAAVTATPNRRSSHGAGGGGGDGGSSRGGGGGGALSRGTKSLPRSGTRGSSFLGTPASTRKSSRNRPSPASAAAAAASRSREQRQQQQQAGGQSSTASPAGSSAYNGKGNSKKKKVAGGGTADNDDTLSDLSVSAYTEDVLLRVGASGGAVRTGAAGDGGRRGGGGGKEAAAAAAAAGAAGTVPVSWAWPGAAPKRGAARGAMAIAKGIPLPPATPGSGAGSGGDNESDFGGCTGDRRPKRGARGTGGGGRRGSGGGVVTAAGRGSDGEVDGYREGHERVAGDDALSDSRDGGGDGCGGSRSGRSTARRALRR